MIKHCLLAGGVLALTLTLALGACGDNDSSKPPAPNGAPAAGTPTASDALKTQADKLLSDASDYVKNNKMDLADKTITQLEEMKPKLPPEYGPKIDDLRKTFNAAKAGGGMKLPGT